MQRTTLIFQGHLGDMVMVTTTVRESSPAGGTLAGKETVACSGDDVEARSLVEGKRFYPALDGFRAVAVLMVFYQHYLGYLAPSLNWGWAGVDFFFVLSGFLITGILYDARDTRRRFRTFYTRRALRIFPLYYGVLLCGLLLNPVFHWQSHPAWYLWPLHLGNYARFVWLGDWGQHSGAIEYLRATHHAPFFLNFGHLWSLCVEEQFYLLWPPVVFLIGDRVRLRNLCVTVCVLYPLLRGACAMILPSAYLEADLLYRLTPFRIDALLMGAALALALRGPEARLLLRWWRPVMVFLGVSLLALEACALCSTGHLYHPLPGAPVLTTIGYSLLDLLAAGLIVMAIRRGSLISRVLAIKPLQGLGKVSYGFYVFHEIPHLVYTALFSLTLARYVGNEAAPYAIAAFALSGTLALSFLSFRYFETPFLRLKERLA